MVEHMPIAARASEKRACTGGFDACVAVLLREPEESEARAVAPLRVSALAKDHITERTGAFAHGRCPGENA